MKTANRIASLLLCSLMLTSTASAAVNKTPSTPVKLYIPSRYSQVYDRIKDYIPGMAEPEDVVWVDEYEPTPDFVLNGASGMFPGAAYDGAPTETPAETMAAAAEEPVAEAEPQTSKAALDPDYDGTNVQVDGIDEGDIVKTDGEYIYVLSDNVMRILKAAGKNTKLISTTTVTQEYMNAENYYTDYENTVEMYVNDDYAAVITEAYMKQSTDPFRHDGTTYTILYLYDVTNPASPKLVSKNGQQGSLKTSRMADDSVYIITNSSVEASSEIKVTDTDKYIPHFYQDNVKGKLRLAEPSEILMPPDTKCADYVVMSNYSLDKKGSMVDTKVVIGEGSCVYMSEDYLYIADSRWYVNESKPYTVDNYTAVDYADGSSTNILKFEYKKAFKTCAICDIKGRLLNQFSLDEYDGNLRVVTQRNDTSYTQYTDKKYGFVNYLDRQYNKSTSLYILDKYLDMRGSIENIANGEDVKSVRFDGNVGYFVTYLNTDPLFCANLSNPDKPKIVSQLKIPGFSSYLHPYGDDLLLGIGQTDNGNVKLSMFDVLDPYNVTEKYVKKDNNRADSRSMSNHKTMLVLPEMGVIGFPVRGSYLVFNYSDKSGFTFSHEFELENYRDDARGVRIGGFFYIVSTSMTEVVDLETMKPVKHIVY